MAGLIRMGPHNDRVVVQCDAHMYQCRAKSYYSMWIWCLPPLGFGGMIDYVGACYIHLPRVVMCGN